VFRKVFRIFYIRISTIYRTPLRFLALRSAPFRVQSKVLYKIRPQSGEFVHCGHFSDKRGSSDADKGGGGWASADKRDGQFF